MLKKRTSRSDRAAWMMRLAWYAMATILVLSLPIFSDWTGVSPTPSREAPALGERGEELLPEAKDEGVAGSVSVGGPKPAAAQDRSGFSGLATTRAPVFGGEREETRLTALARRQSDPPPPLSSVRGEAGVSTALPGNPAADEAGDSTSPRRLPALWGGGASTLQSELNEIDRGYDRAYATLFPQARGSAGATPNNPFEEALNQDGGADDGSAGNGDTPPGEGDSGQPPSDPEPAPDPPDPPPDPGSDPVQPEPDPEPAPPEPAPRSTYRFLLVGDFPGNPPLVSRANLVGNVFVFENSYQVDFFPGALPTLIGFSSGEKLLTTDLNRDGLADFVASRVEPTVGSVVESYLQVSPGRFELHGSTALYLQEVSAFTLFDLTGDGADELVVLVRGSDRLVIYELQNRDWTYIRELVLPFRPGTLMASAAGAPVGTRLLYVTDEALQYVVNLSVHQSQTFRFGSRAPLNHLAVTEIDWTESGPAPLLIFQLQDVLVLAERRAGEIHTIATFDIRRSVPEVILGDYLGVGSRQMLWVP